MNLRITMSSKSIIDGSHVDSKSIQENTMLNTSNHLPIWRFSALNVKGCYKVIYTSHTFRGRDRNSIRTIITCPLTFSKTVMMTTPRSIPVPIPPPLPVSNAVLTDSMQQRDRLLNALRTIEQSIDDIIDEHGMKNDEFINKLRRLPDVKFKVCLITEDTFPVHKCIAIQEYINNAVNQEIIELEERHRELGIATNKRLDVLKDRRIAIHVAIQACEKRIDIISPTSSSSSLTLS